MILTSSSNLRLNRDSHLILNEMMRRSGALYNSLVYYTNKHFESTGKYIGFGSLDVLMKTNKENLSYRALPAQCSQQKVKQFHESYKSFFVLLNKKKDKTFDKDIGTPRFKKKGHKSTVSFATQSFKVVDEQIRLAIPKDLQEQYGVKFVFVPLPKYIANENIKQVTIKPTLNGGVKLQVQYETVEVPLTTELNNWASIDLGIDNLATLTSNVCKPVLISGKPIKSINRYFNKQISKEQSKLKKVNGVYTSNNLNTIRTKRANKLEAEIHKISSFVEEYCQMNEIDTLVIGYNKGWKDKVSLGKRTNQKFVSIPYTKLIQYITYKLKLKGINVVIQEESYTSKCSYFDNEPIKKQSTYKGTRTKRGCFITGSGVKINADVNGSLNIARKFLQRSKVANDVSMKPVGIGFVMNPVRLNLDTTTSVACVNGFIINLQIESVKLLKKDNTF